MSVRCQVTGKRPIRGKRVSHSQVRTNRQWLPNTQRRRYWLPSDNRWVRLQVSTKGMKTIDKRGIESVVAEIRARGERV